MTKTEERKMADGFEGMDSETVHTIAGWRNHLLMATILSDNFQMPSIPKDGRWLKISGREKSRTWKPQKGEMYLFKNEGALVNPRTIMRFEGYSPTGEPEYKMLWSMASHLTHVWVKK